MDFLQEIMKSELSNGVLVVTERIPNVKSISLGFWVDVGSRDECEELQGCSHFIEHLLRRGTEKRTAYEISTVIESKGGYLNAFTSRDMTCYFAHVLEQDMELAIEVISDMIQNPLIKEEDIKRERGVIINEINERNDNPKELIEDLFVEIAWKGSQVAHSVLGNTETIENITRDQILGYLKNHYVPGRMLVSVAGNLEHETIVENVESHIKNSLDGRIPKRTNPRFFRGYEFIENKFNQVQLCIGTEGVAYGNDEKATLDLITAYLGVGASSKLFQELREKRGLLYEIGAQNYCLRDAGLIEIFESLRKEKVEQVFEITLNEIEKIRSGIELEKLEETKRKVAGNLILDAESTLERMESLGISTLYLGGPKEIQEEIKDLESVTSEQIAQVADQIFDVNKLMFTAIGLNREEVETLDSMIA